MDAAVPLFEMESMDLTNMDIDSMDDNSNKLLDVEVKLEEMNKGKNIKNMATGDVRREK